MSSPYPPLAVRVWGEFALFTRPDAKVERVSYPLPTPSAARGILEAILYKPEMYWQIREIQVLKSVQYFSILRNEVSERISHRSAENWVKSGGGFFVEENRTQRHSLALRDVAYVIFADIGLNPGANADVAKYRDQFRRRVRDGRCFSTPYFGCREFSASFAEPDGAERPIDWTEELGPMLLDLNYAKDGSGRGRPVFFDAKVERGILKPPDRPL